MAKKPALLSSKLVYLALFVALQVAALYIMFRLFRNRFASFYTLCWLISAASMVHVLGSRSNPAYKIAWLVPILLFPIFGGSFYFLFRKSKLPRRKKALARSTEKRYEALMRGVTGDGEALAKEAPDAARQARYLMRGANAPVWRNTRARYFPSGESFFPVFLADLAKAEKYIFMEYFIVEDGRMWDQVVSILEEKAKQGVDVRLLYDDFGCLLTLPRGYDAALRRRGIQAHAFSRFKSVTNSRFNNRDHRKICVVDGKVGYTGGLNMADEYINAKVKYGYWKDTAVRLEGDAVVNLIGLFLSMWNFVVNGSDTLDAFRAAHPQRDAEGWVLPYGDSPLDSENVGENVYLNMIAHARKFIYFTTPYLILDNEMITALCLAARSGVDVRIITPRIPDKKIVFATTRANYAQLMDAGVRIFEFTPGFIHAKMAVCDGESAAVGTINMDFRSLFLHYECGCWFYRSPVVADVLSDIRATFLKSRELTPEAAKAVAPNAALSALLRFVSPMM